VQSIVHYIRALELTEKEGKQLHRRQHKKAKQLLIAAGYDPETIKREEGFTLACDLCNRLHRAPIAPKAGTRLSWDINITWIADTMYLDAYGTGKSDVRVGVILDSHSKKIVIAVIRLGWQDRDWTTLWLRARACLGGPPELLLTDAGNEFSENSSIATLWKIEKIKHERVPAGYWQGVAQNDQSHCLIRDLYQIARQSTPIVCQVGDLLMMAEQRRNDLPTMETKFVTPNLRHSLINNGSLPIAQYERRYNHQSDDLFALLDASATNLNASSAKILIKRSVKSRGNRGFDRLNATVDFLVWFYKRTLGWNKGVIVDHNDRKTVFTVLFTAPNGEAMARVPLAFMRDRLPHDPDLWEPEDVALLDEDEFKELHKEPDVEETSEDEGRGFSPKSRPKSPSPLSPSQGPAVPSGQRITTAHLFQDDNNSAGTIPELNLPAAAVAVGAASSAVVTAPAMQSYSSTSNSANRLLRPPQAKSSVVVTLSPDQADPTPVIPVPVQADVTPIVPQLDPTVSIAERVKARRRAKAGVSGTPGASASVESESSVPLARSEKSDPSSAPPAKRARVEASVTPGASVSVESESSAPLARSDKSSEVPSDAPPAKKPRMARRSRCIRRLTVKQCEPDETVPNLEENPKDDLPAIVNGRVVNRILQPLRKLRRVKIENGEAVHAPIDATFANVSSDPKLPPAEAKARLRREAERIGRLRSLLEGVKEQEDFHLKEGSPICKLLTKVIGNSDARVKPTGNADNYEFVATKAIVMPSDCPRAPQFSCPKTFTTAFFSKSNRFRLFSSDSKSVVEESGPGWYVCIKLEDTAMPNLGAKTGTLEVTLSQLEQWGISHLGLAAIDDEIDSILNHECLDLSDQTNEEPENWVSSRIIVSIKCDLRNGILKKVKARWVARGFEDQRDLHVRSHTCMERTVILALKKIADERWKSGTSDVNCAFLRGRSFRPDEEKVFMEPAKLARKLRSETLTHRFVRLAKPVYGLKDAPVEWEDFLANKLKSYEFERSNSDPCLWVLRELLAEDCESESPIEKHDRMMDEALGITPAPRKGRVIGVLLYHVDDLLFGGTDFFLEKVTQFLAEFSTTPDIHEPGVGELFIGKLITPLEERSGFTVDMRHYEEKVETCTVEEQLDFIAKRGRWKGNKRWKNKPKSPCRRVIGEGLWSTRLNPITTHTAHSAARLGNESERPEHVEHVVQKMNELVDTIHSNPCGHRISGKSPGDETESVTMVDAGSLGKSSDYRGKVGVVNSIINFSSDYDSFRASASNHLSPDPKRVCRSSSRVF
jgi:hypothetical protein